ncbi:rod shape-determining protein RodA [Paenibacillus albiflavus]|uniref:Rod shape-determining protein RodA n=2 Tax=Paenibacillus albiflavus TaxID=2545760 RepID=A0A4R4E8C5_9BACL|nr:rod shape-determining protein RodA [Paenibacillus albiflavus]
MDYIIIGILVILSVLSILLIHSATIDDTYIKPISIKKLITVNTVCIFAFILASLFNYKTLLKFSPYIYLIGIVLLIGIFFFGSEKNGARGWYEIPGGLDLQPAEIMKIILVIILTYILYRKNQEPLLLIRDVVPVVFVVFIPFMLVLVQPDLGNAIIYLVILIGMLWIGNLKYSHAIIGIAILVGGYFLFDYLYSHNHEVIGTFLKEKGFGHWADRLDTYFAPEFASKDQTYHVDNARLAIGSGELLGRGYMKGDMIHSGKIPYSYSDSIFVVIGEEFGFVGAAGILILYFILIYRLILIAINSKSTSGPLIIVGIVSMYIYQIFQNIGMMVGIIPLTGITLPFISYGGTSLLINMVAIGLAMSVHLHQEEDSVL